MVARSVLNVLNLKIELQGLSFLLFILSNEDLTTFMHICIIEVSLLNYNILITLY